MPQKKKLLDKVRRNPRNVSIKEFESLARQYGYIEEGSKHPKVIIGDQTLIYKRESRMETCYLLDIIDPIL